MSDYEDVKVTDLVINNISQEKYDELKTAGQLEATQIYLTPTEEGGGDYLPITGGEMTGLLTLNATQKVDSPFGVAPLLRIKAETEDGSTQLDKTFTITPYGYLQLSGINVTCDSVQPSNRDSMLGNYVRFWNTVYTTKLHHGADLAVPTEGGTLARVEDIDAAVGDISTTLTAILGE